MGRRTHRHWLRTREPKQFGVYDDCLRPTGVMEDDTLLIAYCGDQTRESWDSRQRSSRFAKEEGRVDCPKCCQAIAKQRLRARPADASELKLERDKAARGGFRFEGGWQLWIGGEHVGWTGFEDHYWRIYKITHWRDSDGDDQWTPATLLGPEGHGQRSARYGGVYDAYALRSKEQALLLAEELRAQGRLPTRPEIEAQEREGAIRFEQEQADRGHRAQEKRQAEDDTLQGLKEIADAAEQAEIRLSNFQREALRNAIERLVVKPV